MDERPGGHYLRVGVILFSSTCALNRQMQKGPWFLFGSTNDPPAKLRYLFLSWQDRFGRMSFSGMQLITDM